MSEEQQFPFEQVVHDQGEGSIVFHLMPPASSAPFNGCVGARGSTSPCLHEVWEISATDGDASDAETVGIPDWLLRCLSTGAFAVGLATNFAIRPGEGSEPAWVEITLVADMGSGDAIARGDADDFITAFKVAYFALAEETSPVP